MNIPTAQEYKKEVDNQINSGKLTVEQGIILYQVYLKSLDGIPTNINYLMSVTGCTWKEINYLINGLVLRGALTKVEDKHVATKGLL